MIIRKSVLATIVQSTLVLMMVGIFVFYSQRSHADSESYLYGVSSVKEEAPKSNNPIDHIRDVFQEPVTVTDETTTLSNNNQIYAITEIFNSSPALPVKPKEMPLEENPVEPVTESPLISSLGNMQTNEIDKHFSFIEGHRNDALPIPQKSRPAETKLTNATNRSEKINEESRSALISNLSPEQINVLNLVDNYTQAEKPFNFSRDLVIKNVASYESVAAAKVNTEGDALMIFLQIAVIILIFLQELLFLCARLSLIRANPKNPE